MNELALFAGAGGGILGGKLLGWKTVCAVEINTFRARRLMQRQNEGHLSPFPIWDDVCTFNGREWHGLIDVVSGGFPCQDVSVAGKGLGLAGARSGLWKEFSRIISEVRPRIVLVENSPNLRKLGLDRVLADFAEMGFDAEWGCLGGREVGASHKRERIWILASNSDYAGLQGSQFGSKNGSFTLDNLASLEIWPRNENELSTPRLLGTGNGMADRVERTKAIGNGQIPVVAAAAWKILSARMFSGKEEE